MVDYENRLREAIGQGPRRKLYEMIEAKINLYYKSTSANKSNMGTDEMLKLAKALAYIQICEEKEMRAIESLDEDEG